MKISVVIPTFQRRDSLEVVLPSLLRQSFDPDEYEILLCDAGSTDGTAVRDALEARDAFRGASAVYDFTPEDHNGISTTPVVMARIGEGGALTILP